jgi:hypothetical protein
MVCLYKNTASIGSYTAKGTPTPVRWNGQNYQQFWTVNYQGAIFATNGINVPLLQQIKACNMLKIRK